MNLIREHHTAATGLAVGKILGADFLSAEERKAIIALQEQAAEFERAINASDCESARREIARLRADYERKPSAEVFAKLEAAELGRKTLEKHYENLLSVVKNTRRNWISSTAAPVVVPILNRAADALTAFAAERRRAEDLEHADFGVDYFPSKIVLAAGQRAVSFRQTSENLSEEYPALPDFGAILAL